MLPIKTNTTPSPTFLDLSGDIIIPYLSIEDVRNCSLLCSQLYQTFQKDNQGPILDLHQYALEHIFILLTPQDLKNCSLTCRQLGGTIHKDSFWQKKAFIDFAPIYQPMQPHKEWYALQHNRKLDKTHPLYFRPKRVGCTSMESGTSVKKVMYSLFTMRQPNQLCILKEKKTMTVNFMQVCETDSPPIFLVGYNAILVHAATAFRSLEDGERSQVAPKLFSHLPHHIKNEIYEEFYEFMPRLNEAFPEYRGFEAGQVVFENTSNGHFHTIDPNKKAKAIENYITMDRFRKLPQAAKNQVYGELYEIIKPSVHYWGWGEHAFHDQHGVTRQQKIEAIQRHFDHCNPSSS